MDNLTPDQRRRNMQNIRSEGTKPEQKIMSELKRRKLHFAQHVKSLPGNPDIVFRRKKVIVMIDSDFWHGHPKRFPMPASNQEYWRQKIARNKKRDMRVNRILRKQGWKVVRIWEYDVKHNFDKVVRRILRTLEEAETEKLSA